MADMPPVTIHDQLACAQRELRMREHVYPRRVANGQMTKELAARETEGMRAIIVTLERLAGAANLI